MSESAPENVPEAAPRKIGVDAIAVYSALMELLETSQARHEEVLREMQVLRRQVAEAYRVPSFAEFRARVMIDQETDPAIKELVQSTEGDPTAHLLMCARLFKWIFKKSVPRPGGVDFGRVPPGVDQDALVAQLEADGVLHV